MKKGIYNPNNIEKFSFVLVLLSVVIDDFTKEMVGSGKALNLPQQVFNKLLLRTRSNLEALICLLDVYKEQSFIFHSISHIYRTLLVDFLNFCYLMSFYDPEEPDFSSFKNEYDFFNRDYLKSLLEMDEVERLIPQECPMYDIVNKSQEKREQNLIQLKTYFAHLYRNSNINGEIKTAEELRVNSKDSLFESKDDRANPKIAMLSEKRKFRRILKSDYKEYADIFIYYKYFTQQYHFSGHSNLHAGQDSSGENYHNLVWCTYRMTDFVKLQIQEIVGDRRYEEKIHQIQTQLTDCLKPTIQD
ncbi:hypothetical protein [Fontibacter flavus]|uniref:Cthe-2314-like HEPN domain-containing protein n=1 Tax=Fontibacter flavus TaxID=654838 RepID=A0ABV6FT06_9BACT